MQFSEYYCDVTKGAHEYETVSWYDGVWYTCKHCGFAADGLLVKQHDKYHKNLKDYEQFLTDSFGTWKEPLKNILYGDYFKSLGALPRHKGYNIFEAFNACPFEETKVIILGQEPYMSPIYPNGIAFGCEKDTPYALRKIKEAISEEYHHRDVLKHGNFDTSLRLLASQGVLFLNASLTYPFSGAWAKFIKFVMFKAPTDIVMTWGSKASELVSFKNYRVLSTGHPSSSFYGEGRFNPIGDFKRVNKLLKSDNKTEINWTITNKSKELGIPTPALKARLSIAH